MADREVDPWVCSRKGKLGSSDTFIGGVGDVTPNISDIARKLVKSRLCFKRNGQGLFYDLFCITNSILLLLVVLKLSKHTPRFH